MAGVASARAANRRALHFGLLQHNEKNSLRLTKRVCGAHAARVRVSSASASRAKMFLPRRIAQQRARICEIQNVSMK